MLFNIIFVPAVLVGFASAMPDRMPSGEKGIDYSKFKFKAPGKNDLRGPCPGLNTLVFLLAFLAVEKALT